MMTFIPSLSSSLSRRSLLAASGALFAAGLTLGSVDQSHAGTDRPTVVVELFTSQGCSSCPPADKLLGELANDPDVIALTEAVDYWDYLGWKDVNARHEHTERQQNYARARGDRRVYTPQMVINGRVHVVGSRRSEVTKSVKNLSQGSGGLSVPIDARTAQETLNISISARTNDQSDVKDGTIYLAPFKHSVKTDIQRGENRGRSITYHNVVDHMRPIGMWHGEAINIKLPLSEIRKGGFDGYAVILQADVGGLPGPIYGATKVELR